MDGLWYQCEETKERLAIFGRALQGPSPYTVILEPNSKRCRSGYCNFTAQTIVVNPTLFSGSAKEQYQLTKALLVHEAAHRRYTVPEQLPNLVRKVANILEDERVERRMCEEFPGVTWLLRQLSERFYQSVRSANEASDLPQEVVVYFLQLRWAARIGQPVKGNLSPKNLLLWEKVEPLVYEAWQADTSFGVSRCAEQIVDILGLVEPKACRSTSQNTIEDKGGL